MIHNKPRMNNQIRITPVRVVNQDGEMLGEMDTARALELAADAGLDLVEVGADARPPVCRIMDYAKLEYERSKKQSSGPKKRQSQLKQIRLRAKTGQHDIDFKVKQARDFLERRDKVKVNVMFRGRENAHHDRGKAMLEEIIVQLADVADVEKFPMMEGGRMMTMMLMPKAK